MVDICKIRVLHTLPGLIKTPGGSFINGLRLRIGIRRLRFESIERDSDGFRDLSGGEGATFC